MIKLDVNDELAVREAGYKALTEALGSAGFLKFMQLMYEGKGDYTKEKYDQPDKFIPWEQLENLSRTADKG